MSYIKTSTQGHVFLICLNRPKKYNAFTCEMLDDLASAYTELEDNPDLRCGLLYAEGDNLTAGLDLADVTPKIKAGGALSPVDLVDPFQVTGRKRSKPIVVAAKGYCLTVAMELIMAGDICVAHVDSKFGQIEVKRGIMPFGGATVRMPQRCGWGNAMRYLLTGDFFDGREAYRIGFVQEITKNDPFEKALEIATTIAEQAPIAVQDSLLNSRKMLEDGPQAAIEALLPLTLKHMSSEDSEEGLNSFIERRKAVFTGR